MEETIDLYKKRYLEDPCYENYSHLVMANLLSPYEDYVTAIELVEQTYSRYSDKTLVFVAASLAIDWHVEASKWIGIINAFLVDANDKEKAIIYYLNANYIETTLGRKVPEYRKNLEKSIDYSTETYFYNNYRDLANISSGAEKEKWRKNAEKNVFAKLNHKQIQELKEDYFLDPNMWVNEHILGIIRT